MSLCQLLILVLILFLSPLDTATTTCKSSPFGGATRFNAVLLGNFEASSSDVEGALAVSGNINIAAYTIGAKLNCTTPATDNAIAGGSFNWTGGDLKTGNLVYGTTKIIPQTVGWGCQSGVSVPQIQRDSTTFFAGLRDDLQSTSTYLKSLASTGVTQRIYSSLYFNLSTSAINVLSTTCSDLSGVTEYMMVGSSSSTVIVNVLGTGPCQIVNGGFQPNGWNWQRVIWNFPQATSLAHGSVQGTVLAPFADINMGTANSWGAVNGQVFGKNWRGSVQINNFPFIGCIPQTSSSSSTTSTGSTSGSTTSSSTSTSSSTTSSSSSTGTTNTGTSGPCAIVPSVPATCSCTPVGTDCACSCDCC